MSEKSSVKQLDKESLTAWMSANVNGFAGPLTVEKFPGGQSNPTYQVETPNTNYVLRRKPPGKLLPGAHAVERDFRIMSALESQGVPVPHCFALCEDDAVLGTPFYIMEKVEGRIFWDPKLPEVPEEQRASYYESMGDVIAALHNVNYVKAGLETGCATGCQKISLTTELVAHWCTVITVVTILFFILLNPELLQYWIGSSLHWGILWQISRFT